MRIFRINSLCWSCENGLLSEFTSTFDEFKSYFKAQTFEEVKSYVRKKLYLLGNEIGEE